ncbi:MAG: YeiH family protein [Candidatus Xenobia bacterium]
MARLLYLAALLLCLTPLMNPATALALGVVLALAMENPWSAQGRKASKLLLQLSVVLLGFGTNLHVMMSSGLQGAVFAIGTIAASFGVGAVLARRLDINRSASTLISAGTAICGGSAIAAVGAVIGAAEADMAVAMGTVFILNGVALYLFPMLGHLLHLSAAQFGTWAGIAIHDVSSVVGAASQYSDASLPIATAVKLSRALWIAPLSLWIGHRMKRQTKAKLPWFIVLFVVASAIGSFVPAMHAPAALLFNVAKVGLTATLFLIGAGLSRRILAQVGWKPLLQGFVLWIFLAAVSLPVVLTTVH